MKIGQYLTKLCVDYIGLLFLAHPVFFQKFYGDDPAKWRGAKTLPDSSPSTSGGRSIVDGEESGEGLPI